MSENAYEAAAARAVDDVIQRVRQRIEDTRTEARAFGGTAAADVPTMVADIVRGLPKDHFFHDCCPESAADHVADLVQRVIHRDYRDQAS